MTNKRFTAVILAAALCTASCGKTASDETETVTAAVTAVTSTAAVTTAKTETSAASTTKKSTKKKVTTTTMDKMVEAEMWNYPELIEPVNSYMDYAAKNPEDAEPDIKTFEGDGYSLKIDMSLWEQTNTADSELAFKRIDGNRNACFDIAYKDFDEGTLPDVRELIGQINHDYSLLRFPEDKDERESQLYTQLVAGYDAVVLNAAVGAPNSMKPPSERFGAMGVIVGDRLYQIRYSYPIYMPYADTGIEDILDSLVLRR